MQLLEDSCSTVLYWPPPRVNTNQPQVYICPLPPGPPSHLSFKDLGGDLSRKRCSGCSRQAGTLCVQVPEARGGPAGAVGPAQWAEGRRNRKADADTEGSGGKVHPPGATWAEQLWAGQVL